MRGAPQNRIVVDSGFWFALYCKSDQHFDEAKEKAGFIDSGHLVLPWPTLYETVNTRFIKNRTGLAAFEDVLRKPGRVTVVDDAPYRNDAFDLTFRQSGFSGGRTISMVDMIIRLMMEDEDVRIDAILTFNPKDFADVCRRRSVTIL